MIFGQINGKEADYIWLLMGYGIAQYIHEQLHCQACLEVMKKEDANDPRDFVIKTHKYLKSEFAKPEVYDAFHNDFDLYKFVILKHVVERDIDKRLQATIGARVAFFREAGSCNNGVTHRTNLLGFVINFLGFKNLSQMCRRFEGTSRGKRSKDVKGPPNIQTKRIVYYTDKKKMKSNSTLIASSPHIDDDSLHTKVRFAFILFIIITIYSFSFYFSLDYKTRIRLHTSLQRNATFPYAKCKCQDTGTQRS
ncbi:uncharacterized protein ACN427_012783 isoform 2-T6 [Glossina fuscipes fuscipes]